MAGFPIDFGKTEQKRRCIMGGLGSGERWSKKNVVEDCYALDATRLKRWKLLTPGITHRAGSFEWTHGGDEKPSSSVSYWLTIGQNSSTLRLFYIFKPENTHFDYSVQLVTTPCHLGGVRWWFMCPLSRNSVACGRR